MDFIFDTETTGLPLFRERSHDPRQPHCVQLAYEVVDPETKVIMNKTSTLIDVGVDSEPVALETHKITREMTNTFGITAKNALDQFMDNIRKAKRVIGHNVQFDIRIMRIMAARHEMADELKAIIDTKEVICTMNKSKPIVKCPPTEKMVASGRGGFKAPKLSEAYLHFTGNELEGAHDALVDVDACREILYIMEAA